MKSEKKKAMWGCLFWALVIAGAFVFWGGLAYVAFHFILKFW